VHAVEAIRSAIETLGAHPLIGRLVTAEIRELVISFGRTGYVALYRFVPSRREVRILAIRHQRELDYPA
jgi:plasmid stabilization system protein ParE